MSDEVVVNTRMPRELAAELEKIAEELSKKSGGIKFSRSDISRIAVTKFIRDYRIVGWSELPGPGDHEPVPVVIVDPYGFEPPVDKPSSDDQKR